MAVPPGGGEAVAVYDEHKYSTAAFRISPRKLKMLADQIGGKPIDHAILQMQFSGKKASKRIKSTLALAREHAVQKGLRPNHLVVAEAWVGKGRRYKTLVCCPCLRVLFLRWTTDAARRTQHRAKGPRQDGHPQAPDGAAEHRAARGQDVGGKGAQGARPGAPARAQHRHGRRRARGAPRGQCVEAARLELVASCKWQTLQAAGMTRGRQVWYCEAGSAGAVASVARRGLLYALVRHVAVRVSGLQRACLSMAAQQSRGKQHSPPRAAR